MAELEPLCGCEAGRWRTPSGLGEAVRHPVLNWLSEQAMAATPNLQTEAEQFVQVHDVMSQARSQSLPRVGMEFGASYTRQSFNKLLRPLDSPLQLNTAAPGAIAPMDTYPPPDVSCAVPWGVSQERRIS